MSKRKLVLKEAIKMLDDFDGLTLTEVEDLASESEANDDYYKAYTDDNSEPNAEEKGESFLSHIIKKKWLHLAN